MTKGRRMLVLLALIFFLPLAVSFALYYGTSWRPQGLTNHGTLIDPPRPLPPVKLGVSASDPLRGKWTMLYVGDGRCDAACQRALVFIRQTRLSLNREMERVNRVWLAPTNCCDKELVAREHEGLVTVDASVPQAAALVEELKSAGASPDAIFVTDPLGNLVLSYDTREAPKGLLEDLKKLLKLSHIG